MLYLKNHRTFKYYNLLILRSLEFQLFACHLTINWAYTMCQALCWALGYSGEQIRHGPYFQGNWSNMNQIMLQINEKLLLW